MLAGRKRRAELPDWEFGAARCLVMLVLGGATGLLVWRQQREWVRARAPLNRIYRLTPPTHKTLPTSTKISPNFATLEFVNHRPTTWIFVDKSTSHRHDGYVAQPPRSLLCASGRDSEIRFSLRTWQFLLPVENSSSSLPAEPFPRERETARTSVETMHRWSTRASMSILGPKG